MIDYLTQERLWLLEPEAFLRLAALPRLASMPQLSPQGDDEYRYEQQGSLATVTIHGKMLRRATEADRAILHAYGLEYTEMEKAAKVLQKLAADPSVSVVLLDIDSPGGTVNGTPELAHAVRSLSKQKYVYAYTAGLACSAAYWVASQCDGIYAAPSARVGSIGVLMPLIDSSEALSQRGVKLDVFAAGKYKSTGTPGTALTDEQRELLQRQVNDTWEEFKAAVTHRRRTIAAEHMEGQTFTGKEARTIGLVDACANSLAAIQQKLQDRHGNL